MLGKLLPCLMLGVLSSVNSARILSVLAISARSHNNLFEAILKALVERGHEVVSYNPFPLAHPIVNYTVVHVDFEIAMKHHLTKEKLDEMMTCSPSELVTSSWNDMAKLMQIYLKNNKVLELFKSEEKYDLIILEPLFSQEIFLGLGHKFNAPVIAVQPFVQFILADKASGSPLSLSYIPDAGFPYSDHMTFYERFFSAYSKLNTLYKFYTQHLPSVEDQMMKIYNDPTMPPLVDMVHNISLIVNNAHPYVHYSQPYTPNMIPIGGIHLARETKPLPANIKNFMDYAKNGVVYFSLGSIVPDHIMPQQYFDNFLAAFRRLPQRVVWKTGAELPGLPDNVITVKWAPQQDILAHLNTVLFITHGGIFSQHEAINAGVPVVCIPFFADQPLNARFYVERGVGVELPFKSLSEETIYTAITEILNTPKYKDNMRRLSTIYRDRPVSPADSMVFWVEYVLRHRGAPHLRPASAAMAWYQLALLDVIAVAITIMSLISIIIYLVLKTLLCLYLPKTQSDRRQLKKIN